jgi:dGTP triphosphohydrolase
MKILFWLYKSKISKKDLIPLMMRITINGQRTNFPTHILIEENQWNHNKQQIRGSGPLTEKYNTCLMDLKIKSWEALNSYLKNNEQATSNMIKEYIKGTKTSNYSLLETMDV